MICRPWDLTHTSHCKNALLLWLCTSSLLFSSSSIFYQISARAHRYHSGPFLGWKTSVGSSTSNNRDLIVIIVLSLSFKVCWLVRHFIFNPLLFLCLELLLLCLLELLFSVLLFYLLLKRFFDRVLLVLFLFN